MVGTHARKGTGIDSAEAYNYERFDRYVAEGTEATEFDAFADHLHVGQPAPDAVVTRLDDGATERLSDRWRRRMVVMEFGSYT